MPLARVFFLARKLLRCSIACSCRNSGIGSRWCTSIILASVARTQVYVEIQSRGDPTRTLASRSHIYQVRFSKARPNRSSQVGMSALPRGQIRIAPG